MFLQYIYQKKVIAIEKYRQKNQFNRRAMMPASLFFGLLDRTRFTEQLLFYMSLQNIDELNVIQRFTKTLVQVSH